MLQVLNWNFHPDSSMKINTMGIVSNRQPVNCLTSKGTGKLPGKDKILFKFSKETSLGSLPHSKGPASKWKRVPLLQCEENLVQGTALQRQSFTLSLLVHLFLKTPTDKLYEHNPVPVLFIATEKRSVTFDMAWAAEWMTLLETKRGTEKAEHNIKTAQN